MTEQTARVEDTKANSTQTQQGLEAKRWHLWLIIGLVGLGTVGVLTYGLDIGIRFAVLSLFVGGTSLLAGLLLGFLFGIPRTIQYDSPSIENTSDRKKSPNNLQYRFNTNLEQISDWFTKILVGVGLTQVTAIKDLLGQAASKIADSANEPIGTAYPAIIILYYVTSGFLLGYLWTRLDFSKLLVRADKDALEEIEERLQLHEEATQARFKKQEEVLENVAEGMESAIEYGVGGPRSTAGIRASSVEEASTLSAAAPPFFEDLDSRIKRLNLPPTSVKADLNKNRFGGEPDANGRRLKARVTPIEVRADKKTRWYKITLTVESTDPRQPLTGTVIFFLHDTFNKPAVEVPVRDGKATFVISAYAPFTVGAVADDGETRLELDLFEIRNPPKGFISW